MLIITLYAIVSVGALSMFIIHTLNEESEANGDVDLAPVVISPASYDSKKPKK